MNNIQVRNAEKKDLPSIQKLLSELGYGPVEIPQLTQTWTEIMSLENMGIIVSEVDGQIAGYLAYSLKPQLRLCSLSMEIDELCISETLRGRGIGTSLINKAKDIASKQSARQIIISTNRERESYKRGFYTKNGFLEKNSAWLKIDL